mgnify:CR=1 FL=1
MEYVQCLRWARPAFPRAFSSETAVRGSSPVTNTLKGFASMRFFRISFFRLVSRRAGLPPFSYKVLESIEAVTAVVHDLGGLRDVESWASVRRLLTSRIDTNQCLIPAGLCC